MSPRMAAKTIFFWLRVRFAWRSSNSNIGIPPTTAATLAAGKGGGQTRLARGCTAKTGLIASAGLTMLCRMGWGGTRGTRALRGWRFATLAAVALLAASQPAAADDRQMICQAISDAAAANGLPVGFLARLLWTESGFRSEATSPAGA